MKNLVIFSRLSAFLTAFCIIQFCISAQAQVISPSAEEVNFSYTTTFQIPTSADEQTDEDRAVFHAQHMFGIMHSATLINKYGIKSETMGGIGAPQSQMDIQIIDSKVVRNNVVVTYSNAGRILLNKKAAKEILKAGVLTLPLPTNPYKIYKKKCTDAHYYTFGDYWYFYDPFKDGCTSLSESPLATSVDIKISKVDDKPALDITPRLPYLRGDNDNGDLFSVYVIHGFSEGLSVKTDEGRVNFNEFDDYLRQEGFDESRAPSGSVVPLHVFTKTITLDNGKKLNVEVKHMLVETEIQSKSVAFAKFFKDAVENADVILYGGHSGLGGNLDIPSLEAKAGAYKFNTKKKQLFFFDSCSSYSYYLQVFSAQKTKAKIDILTNGLSSYFNTSNAVFVQLMKHLLTPKTTDVPWIDILKDMERVLKGDTYLLNVGGV